MMPTAAPSADPASSIRSARLPRGRRGAPPALAKLRIIPVSDPFIPDALALSDQLSRASVRAEVDDRGETVGKKIRAGEEDWIPYLIAFGEKERSSGQLSVRVREDGSRRELCAEALAALIREKTRGMPFRPLPLPAP